MEKALDGKHVSGDTSGRMNTVKQAAKDLVDILSPSAGNRVAIGVVPWHVVGRLDDTAMSEWVREGWAAGPSSRRYAFAYECKKEMCTSLDETQDLPDEPGEDSQGCLGEHRLSVAKKGRIFRPSRTCSTIRRSAPSRRRSIRRRMRRHTSVCSRRCRVTCTNSSATARQTPPLRE